MKKKFNEVLNNLNSLSNREDILNNMLSYINKERESIKRDCNHDLIVYFGKKEDESKYHVAECVCCGKEFIFERNSMKLKTFLKSPKVINKNFSSENPMVLFCTFYDETLNKARAEIYANILASDDNLEFSLDEARKIVIETFDKENKSVKEAFNSIKLLKR